MDSAVLKNAAEPRSVDPVWTKIREAAQSAAAAEPVLAGTLHATVLSQPKFESALSYHLARLAGTTEVPAALIRQVRPPEPYRGKGIRYQGERVRIKAGKATK